MQPRAIATLTSQDGDVDVPLFNRRQHRQFAKRLKAKARRKRAPFFHFPNEHQPMDRA